MLWLERTTCETDVHSIVHLRPRCAGHLTVALASAQSPPTTNLSSEVRDYVKFDDAVIVLAHVRVIDGTERAPRVDQTLIIRPAPSWRLETRSPPRYQGAKVLDLTGHTVLPGFVGMHDHMFYPQPVNLAGQRARGVLQFEQQSSFSLPRLYLAAGVTSVRTTASVEPYADLNLKSWIDAIGLNNKSASQKFDGLWREQASTASD